MAICENILTPLVDGNVFDCDAQGGGLLAELIILNKSDISGIAWGANEAATITMVSGKKGAVHEVFKSSHGAESAIKVNENAPNRQSHSVSIRFHNRGGATSATVRKMLNGLFVVITKSKSGGYYEVWGAIAGLEATAQSKNTNENNGTDSVTLATPESSNGDRLGYITEVQYNALKG